MKALQRIREKLEDLILQGTAGHAKCYLQPEMEKQAVVGGGAAGGRQNTRPATLGL